MPDHGQEIEFKLLLPDEPARERLLSLLLRLQRGGPAAPARLQENHFLDTEDGALRAARLVLRLRLEGERRELALKGPRLEGPEAPGALQARAEEQIPLSASEAEGVLGARLDPLELLARRRAESPLVRQARARLGTGSLVHLGAFRNERTRLAGLHLLPAAPEREQCIELDRTGFPGRVEHELELEVDDAAQAPALEQALRTLLEQARIPWRPARSKAERFFRILDGLAGEGAKP